MLVNTIRLGGGDEINVYQDGDGYHAERWDESAQLITRQSGDCSTEADAVARVCDADAE